jgi:hypothetical protein
MTEKSRNSPHQIIHELAFEAAKMAFSNGRFKNSIDPEEIARDLASNYIIARKHLEKEPRHLEEID